MTDAESSAPEPGHLAELFQSHRDGLAGAVRGVLGLGCDPREVLQEAFLKAWNAMRRGERPSDQVGWIFVITLNLAKDQRRRAARRPTPSLDEVADMELRTDEPAPPARLETAETLAIARTAITRLDDGEREVFLLRTSGELSFTATAEALSIPIGTAKTRMRSALQKLRRELHAFDTAQRERRTS